MRVPDRERGGAAEWSGLEVQIGRGRETPRHALPGGTEFWALLPHGGEGISHRRLAEPQIRRPSCAEESLRPLLNIPLFCVDRFQILSVIADGEACDIFSVNTVPGWDRRPCQLTCMWKGPEGSLRLK